MNDAPSSLWLMLGESLSKTSHMAGIPLPRTVANKLRTVFLAKGVVATSAEEGRSIADRDIIDLLDGKLKYPRSREYLQHEIQNLLDACHSIVSNMAGESEPFLSAELVEYFNELVLKELEFASKTIPGAIRHHEVAIGSMPCPASEHCESLLFRTCEWLNTFSFDGPPMAVALIKAILAHLYIAWIRPFGDGNERTARLIDYLILSGAGVPAPAAHLLSNHYSETGGLYYQKLLEAQDNPFIFIEYALKGYIDGLKLQLRTIRDYQWDLAWRDYVNEMFKDKERPSDNRRLHLVLDLAEVKVFVPVTRLMHLSPTTAADYKDISYKTLSRDLEFLETHKLIQRDGDKVRARRENVLRFLPFSRSEDLLNEDNIPLVLSRLDPDKYYSIMRNGHTDFDSLYRENL